MLTNFFRGVASLGAPTYFEKARLSCTYKGDYDPPDDESLNLILIALAGNDPETRSELAFRTLMVKLQYSDSLKYWNYIIKNLIILDRCVEEKYFLYDLRELNFPHIENYKEEDSKFTNMQIDLFVKKYYKLIVEKAKIYSEKNSSFNINKTELASFFKKCDAGKILVDVSNIQYLSTLIFELSKTDKKGYLKFPLNQHVFLLLLSSLLNYYTLHFIGVLLLIDKLLTMTLDQAIEFKTLYANFIKSSDEIGLFIKNHQFIEGFSVSSFEFYKMDPRTFDSINDYIDLLKSNSIDNQELIHISDEQTLIVTKTPKEEQLKDFQIENRRSEQENQNLKTRDEFAQMMNVDMNNMMKGKSLELMKKQSSSTKVRILKNPILVLAKTNSSSNKEKNGAKNIEEEACQNMKNDNFKNDLTEEVIIQKAIVIEENKEKNEEAGKNSILTIENSKIDFGPDFERGIFNNFDNGYSPDFKMSHFKIFLKT